MPAVSRTWSAGSEVTPSTCTELTPRTGLTSSNQTTATSAATAAPDVHRTTTPAAGGASSDRRASGVTAGVGRRSRPPRRSRRPVHIGAAVAALVRVPGGMIAEGFAAIGAKTTLLPGGEVFSALEKGTIEAADYTGPAVNWDLGFQQVSKFIWMGPVGLESIYQPVDLMDFCVGINHWNKLSPKMKQWVEDEVEVYSRIHHAAIQKADMEAWGKFEKAGTQINRLPVEDLVKFQRVAVPIWFKWANKDKDAAHIFKAQLEVMEFADLRLCHARHVQKPEARPLSYFRDH